MGMHYLIIGNGGAGLRAARTIRKRDREGAITIVDEEPHPCYYRMRLPDYISGWRERDTVFVVEEDFYAENGIEFRRNTRVTAVRPDEHEVLLDAGGTISYDRLLIAAGARPRELSCRGSGFDGVVYLRTLDQAEDIIRRGKAAQNAVALGGGLLGVEMARAFNELGLNTHYLIREDRFWPQMLDASGSALVEKVLEEKGIMLHKEEGIDEIEGEGGRVAAVTTTAGKRYDADIVGIAIGVVSNLEFLEGSGLETGRGILVDEHLRASRPDIYADGDIAQALDVASGEYRLVTSWLNTQRQGQIAGVNMSGGDEILEGVVPFNVIVIYGLSVASLGLDIPPEEEGYEALTGDYPKDGRYRKFVLKDGVLVGGTLIGDIGEAQAIESLIKMQADVSDYRDRLFEPGFDAKRLLEEVKGAG
ncbi:MAG: NAD(P)/FAD-dependent oxidoreductase [Actinobacteria bacterium]|nr:NAD(P)/FAD-dependent oxidoreductase [Actinomycetota bacterium]